MQVIRSIQNRIYEIRGERAMLDRDLADLYEKTNKIRWEQRERIGFKK